MKLRDFIKQFTLACREYGFKPLSIWQYLPQDELQALSDDDGWECFEHCLGEWRDRGYIKALREPPVGEHGSPMPDISCNGCKFFDNDFCNRYDKKLKASFNKANACMFWELT